MTIRRLTPADASAYRRLRLRGLRESPTAFGSSHGEETKFSLETFSGWLEPSPGKWVFGAFESERLVGIVSLVREEKQKARHKASIYGLYVERRMRGLKQVRLAVVEANRRARRHYESAGFKVYGREEAALCVDGEFYAEILFVCRRSKSKPAGSRVAF